MMYPIDDDDDIVVNESRTCDRCNAESSEMHHCPYAMEMHGDLSLCNCCDGCENKCAMDI